MKILYYFLHFALLEMTFINASILNKDNTKEGTNINTRYFYIWKHNQILVLHYIVIFFIPFCQFLKSNRDEEGAKQLDLPNI